MLFLTLALVALLALALVLPNLLPPAKAPIFARIPSGTDRRRVRRRRR